MSEGPLLFELEESGINYNLDEHIYNLGKKKVQDTDEAKSKTNHNSVPKKGSNLNGKLQLNPKKNNAHTRDHVDPDPLEDENVAETHRTKDDEKLGDINMLIGEPTKNIGVRKTKFVFKFKEILVGS